ncbi:basic salivary proline-rich protein 4-like [Tachyglossus aculeatus]|uniref:basic salivary proline-rich protein 4-like n=1 Tax=Tachyglossus aculeatus TaxID=9261 RepID=UPI0018F7C274|nr:basic salivary proline-rich protein 4-like [Tachyglossus aculeatus]
MGKEGAGRPDAWVGILPASPAAPTGRGRGVAQARGPWNCPEGEGPRVRGEREVKVKEAGPPREMRRPQITFPGIGVCGRGRSHSCLPLPCPPPTPAWVAGEPPNGGGREAPETQASGTPTRQAPSLPLPLALRPSDIGVTARPPLPDPLGPHLQVLDVPGAAAGYFGVRPRLGNGERDCGGPESHSAVRLGGVPRPPWNFWGFFGGPGPPLAPEKGDGGDGQLGTLYFRVTLWSHPGLPNPWVRTRGVEANSDSRGAVFGPPGDWILISDQMRSGPGSPQGRANGARVRVATGQVAGRQDPPLGPEGESGLLALVEREVERLTGGRVERGLGRPPDPPAPVVGVPPPVPADPRVPPPPQQHTVVCRPASSSTEILAPLGFGPWPVFVVLPQAGRCEQRGPLAPGSGGVLGGSAGGGEGEPVPGGRTVSRSGNPNPLPGGPRSPAAV